jgi:hypothetical protein
MKVLWLEQKFKYDGRQLAPLTNYLQHKILGDSAVAWLGECEVTPEHMIDGEDLLAGSRISADEMVHFVIEMFDFPLKAAILLQRVMAELAIDVIEEQSPIKPQLRRSGDDIYWGEKKLNISIVTVSSNSTLIHFAVNSKGTGAPVPIACLEDFKVPPQKFAMSLMDKVALEVEDVLFASQKVRSF